MNLRESIAAKHRQAEQMPFNQKMLKGELSKIEYLNYLYNLREVIYTIENKINIPDDIKRMAKFDNDTHELEEFIMYDNFTSMPFCKSVFDYTDYLQKLEEQQILPHVYLNYMALMFGGQILKKQVPGSGEIYDFENLQESAKYIRSIQQDEWADEVNKGFDYLIGMFEELEHHKYV